MAIKLLVGLGNPGAQYQDTRHNAGFWLVEEYAAQKGASLGQNKGFFGRVGKSASTQLLLPETFMNRSGQAVAAIANFYKIAPDEILVAHDELDLMPGTVKVKKGGGHAGHNGLRDIAKSIGTPDFWRLRIGIGHPRTLNLNTEVVNFVLDRPRQEERKQIDDAMARALAVLSDLLSGQFERATMALHKGNPPGSP
jgi:PTH1 family peptidyl-tRNA hydrolase